MGQRRIFTGLIAAMAMMSVACGSTIRVGDTAGVAIADTTSAGAAPAPAPADDNGLSVNTPTTTSPITAAANTGTASVGATSPGTTRTGTASTGTTSTGTTSTGAASTGTASTGAANSGAAGTTPGQPAATPGTAPAAAAAPPSTAPSSAPVAGSAANGPGIGEAIRIGIPYAPNADEQQETLGASATSSGDIKGNVEDVIAAINAAGGVSGRPLEPVFYELDAFTTATAAQVAQQICTHFTEDDPVFMVGLVSNSDLRSCLGAAGVLNVTGTTGGLSEAMFAAAPNFYDVSGLATDSAMRTLAPALGASDYFEPWDTTSGGPGLTPPVIGVLVPDAAQWKGVVDNALLPALAAQGYSVAPENIVEWHLPDSQTGNGQAVAEIQNAVIRFRSNGVTHLIPTEQNGMVFFASGAEGQGYRPRYGLTTLTEAQSYGGNLVPYAQLEGARGVGWFPAIDIPASQVGDNTDYQGPGRGACLDIYKQTGRTFGNANEEAVGLLICDIFLTLKQAVGAIPSGDGITVPSVIRQVEGFGSGYAAAGVPGALYGPGRHYPVAKAWPWAFDSACECMTYTGPATGLS